MQAKQQGLVLRDFAAEKALLREKPMYVHTVLGACTQWQLPLDVINSTKLTMGCVGRLLNLLTRVGKLERRHLTNWSDGTPRIMYRVPQAPIMVPVVYKEPHSDVLEEYWDE